MRYSTAIDDMETTHDDQWRLQSTNNKQGSAGLLTTLPTREEFEANLIAADVSSDELHLQLMYYDNFDLEDHKDIGKYLSAAEEGIQNMLKAEYYFRLGCGIAREQARKDLPISNYTEIYWKGDLRNLFNFLSLRLDSHAQLEIREFAQAISLIVQDWVPMAYQAFLDYRLNAVTFSAQEISAIRAWLSLNGPVTTIEMGDEAGGIANTITPLQFVTNQQRQEFLETFLYNKRERIEFWNKLNG